MVVVAGGVECVFVCGEMGNAGTGGGDVLAYIVSYIF
jgi:hypothetical protein